MADDPVGVVAAEAELLRRIDTSVPHIARVYDFLLGGRDNFAVDREAGARAADANPALLQGVLGNRAFLARAVRCLATECGIRQFLDIGTGIPAAANTHEVAQQAAPGSRVVYVDNDPIVLVHARALLTGGSGPIAYLEADVRDTARLLGAAAATLDFAEPIAVMMILLLHCVPDSDDPWALVRELMDAVPAGSYLAITHPTSDFHPQYADEMVSRLNEMMPRQLTFRPREQVLAFFDGLELAEPGLVRAPQWRPDSSGTAANPAQLWAGVARKP